MQILKATAVKSAIVGTYTLLFIAFVIVALYIGQVILIPLALAILLAFLLTPLVSQLDPFLGRIIAVIIVVILMTIAVGFTGYIVSKEFIRFASDIPTYKTNIDAKIYSLRAYQDTFKSAAATLGDLKFKLSGETSPTHAAAPVALFDSNTILLSVFELLFGSFINIIVTSFLVILLVSFILTEREDLRGRIIRLLGQGRIGATSHAITDAGTRVSRYLRMLLLINMLYGMAVAIGLYFLGIPNAFLWGVLSTLLRFVPYVGVWIAAVVPIALSFALSNTWLEPFLTISLFVILEAVCSNIFEPWLYGTSTGVSSTALLIAALFWTWLWGPIGLILSTPLTVCLVVIGRHVPRLEFFSILLSDEEPLTLHEEYYHRLLASNVNEVMHLTDVYLKEKSLASLYDTVLVPVVITGEIDSRKETLDEEQMFMLQQHLADLVEDLSARPISTKATPDQEQENIELKAQHSNVVIVCLPAKAKRDELVGEMLTQLLQQQFYSAFNVSSQLKIEEMVEYVKEITPKIIIISVVPPSTIIQARYITRKMRSNFPNVKIIVGLWSYTENLTEITEALYASGADKVVTSLSDAVLQVDAEVHGS